MRGQQKTVLVINALAMSAIRPRFDMTRAKEPFAHHLKHYERLAILGVLANCSVARHILHVSDLTLAEVMKDFVVVPEVMVAMRHASLASERDD